MGRGTYKMANHLPNAFFLATIKLTPHVFCKIYPRLVRSLTSILLNPSSDNKRGKKGTFLHLSQDHPKNTCKKLIRYYQAAICSNYCKTEE